MLDPALLYESAGLDEQRVDAVQLGELGIEPVLVAEHATHALAVPSSATTGAERGTFMQY